MQTTVIERIKDVISDKKLSVLKFSKEIDFPYNTLNNYVTGQRNAIDINLVIKIVSTFEEISLDWLLLGKGEMHKQLLITANGQKDESLLMKTIIDLSGQVALLKERVKQLEGEERTGYGMVASPQLKYSK